MFPLNLSLPRTLNRLTRLGKFYAGPVYFLFYHSKVPMFCILNQGSCQSGFGFHIAVLTSFMIIPI